MNNNNTTTVRTLACPSCGSVDGLSTLENLEGTAECTRITDAGPEYAGYTDVNYDTSATVGVCCDDCGWRHTGDDWLDKLVPAVDA